MASNAQDEARAFRDSRRILRRMYARVLKQLPNIVSAQKRGEITSVSSPTRLQSSSKNQARFQSTYRVTPIDLRFLVGPHKKKRRVDATKDRPRFEAWELKRIVGYRELDVAPRVYSVPTDYASAKPQRDFSPDLSLLPSIADIQKSIDRLAQPRKLYLPKLAAAAEDQHLDTTVPEHIKEMRRTWSMKTSIKPEEQDAESQEEVTRKAKRGASAREHVVKSRERRRRKLSKCEYNEVEVEAHVMRCANKHAVGVSVDSAQSARDKEEMSDEKKAKIEKDIKDLTTFLARHYRTLEDAWRNLLDTDRTGKIWREKFQVKVREAGWRLPKKELADMWDFLVNRNPESGSMVSLRDLSPRAGARFDEQEKAKKEKEEVEQRAVEAEKKRLASWEGTDIGLKVGVVQLFVRRFGSILNAWDVLDPMGTKRCGSMDFVYVLRNCNFKGDLMKAYRHMDVDGNGFVTLSELDPEADIAFERRLAKKKELEQKLANKPPPEDRVDIGKHTTIEDLKTVMKHRFPEGGILQAWKEVFDPCDLGRCTFVDFCTACREMGFKANLREIFAGLDADESGSLSLNEIDTDACAKYAQEKELLEERKKQEIKQLAKRFAREKELDGQDIAPRTFDELKRELLRQFKTYLNAWRQCLDVRNLGRVSFQDFSNVLRSLNFKSDARKLFNEIDVDGSGIIEVGEFDQHAGAQYEEEEAKRREAQRVADEKWRILGQKEEVPQAHSAKDLRDLLARRFKCSTIEDTQEAAWTELLDPCKLGRVSFADFCPCLRAIGFRGDARAIFAEIDEDGNGFIVREELFPPRVATTT